MTLRSKAITEANHMLSSGVDYQRVIENLFNDRDDYKDLFAGMDDDERFQEAHDIIVEAEPVYHHYVSHDGIDAPTYDAVSEMNEPF